VNCFGTLNVPEASVSKNVSRFLFASSANVYGAPVERPVREITPFNPRLPYDYSKAIAENIVLSHQKHKKLKTTLRGVGFHSERVRLQHVRFLGS
jgi:UDP-glucose 4-epimerase